MKKFAIIAGLVLLLGLLVAPSALAIDVFTHGDFGGNSKGCADCHITHGANAAKLLLAGPTQTDTCFACHGYGRWSSRYDAETGMINGTDGTARPSYAGGFVQSYDFTAAVPDYVYNTSVHSVQKAYQVDTLYESNGQVDGDIPGGGAWTGDFTCGSCHDPHKGGLYPAAGQYINPRLLKLDPLNGGVEHAVYMYIDYDTSAGDSTSGTADNKTLLPVKYGLGFNGWCGACHDVFNTETASGGARTGSVSIANGDGAMKYRHKMGVTVPTQNFDVTLETGLPMPTNTDGSAAGAQQNKLMCLTCHRAHGSSVTVSVGFNRFKGYDGIYGNNIDTMNTNMGASALLRQQERDVCYNCHGAAVQNKFNATTDYSQGN